MQSPVGAALCRERVAQRPQGFSINASIAGAAMRPFRDTRPLPQTLAYDLGTSPWLSPGSARSAAGSPGCGSRRGSCP
ncbi:hypothetical protein DMX06_25485 [Pseudomonas mosselii]|nr:hypothetical protein DMX06_25485 [Pseudomonas mosselii]